MPQVQHARHISTKSAIALLLTFAAGCVDIVGYLAIYQIFTANMTGATDADQDGDTDVWSVDLNGNNNKQLTEVDNYAGEYFDLTGFN
jgi:hypothetical protein